MATRTEDLKFGSYALTSANGVVLESWRDRYLHKATFRPKIKGGGGLKTKDQVQGIEVKMSGRLIGDDTGQLDTRLNDLVRNLSAGEDWLSFYTTRRLRCALVGNVQHQLQRGAPTVRLWSATMRSERQYWESDTPTTNVFTPSGAGPHTFVTASVGGEAPVPPIVKIKKVRTVNGLAKYLAKYLSKDPEKIGTGKRYWFSQNYRQEDEPEQAAARRRFVYKWYREPLQQVVAMLATKGRVGMAFGSDRYIYYESEPP